jgi:hypothetical protein
LKLKIIISGILLWEIFSLGQLPYPGTELDEILFHKLQEGYRMEKPNFATNRIYDIMTDCWEKEPTARPVRKLKYLLMINRFHCNSTAVSRIGFSIW